MKNALIPVWGPLLILATSACHASPPARSDRATLTYTATDMRQGVAGRSIGKGTLTLTRATDFCGEHDGEPDTIEQVSANNPRTTVWIPAGQPLILNSFWSAAGRHCLVSNLAFRAEAGATYRVTTEVGNGRGQCRVRVAQRRADGSYRYLGELQTVAQTCR